MNISEIPSKVPGILKKTSGKSAACATKYVIKTSVVADYTRHLNHS